MKSLISAAMILALSRTCLGGGFRRSHYAVAFAAQAPDLPPQSSLSSPSSSSIQDAKRALATKHKSYKKLQKNKGLLRADRVLSNRGVGSRSETTKLLKARRISQPDPQTGKLVTIVGPSAKIDPNVALFLDGNALPGPPPVALVYHKPKFVLSAMSDGEGRAHLGEKIEQSRFTTKGMHPVGRLDYETTGLILFSSIGDLTQRLLHPRRGIEKEYVATVEGVVNEEELRSKLEAGVETAAGTHIANLLEVSSVGSRECKADKLGDEVSDKRDLVQELADIRLVVKEGKHRMVRRMLANCGHPVVELRRERHGEVRLGELPVGQFRHPTHAEMLWLDSILTQSRG